MPTKRPYMHSIDLHVTALLTSSAALLALSSSHLRDELLQVACSRHKCGLAWFTSMRLQVDLWPDLQARLQVPAGELRTVHTRLETQRVASKAQRHLYDVMCNDAWKCSAVMPLRSNQ